jgi:hypothetical protein
MEGENRERTNDDGSRSATKRLARRVGDHNKIRRRRQTAQAERCREAGPFRTPGWVWGAPPQKGQSASQFARVPRRRCRTGPGRASCGSRVTCVDEVGVADSDDTPVRAVPSARRATAAPASRISRLAGEQNMPRPGTAQPRLRRRARRGFNTQPTARLGRPGRKPQRVRAQRNPTSLGCMSSGLHRPKPQHPPLPISN